MPAAGGRGARRPRTPAEPRQPRSLDPAALSDHDVESGGAYRQLAFVDADVSGRSAEAVVSHRDLAALSSSLAKALGIQVGDDE